MATYFAMKTPIREPIEREIRIMGKETICVVIRVTITAINMPIAEIIFPLTAVFEELKNLRPQIKNVADNK